MMQAYEIFLSLWHQDYNALSNPNIVWTIYGMLFVVLLLENGFLPTAFLPGDSLLLLVGALVAKGNLNFVLTLLILTVGASVGGWLSFIQGRWLSKTSIVQSWLQQVPEHYQQKAEKLFIQHGLVALLIARFTAFIRTLFPMVAGLSPLDSRKFMLFNIVSALIWIGGIMSLGYLLSMTPFFNNNEHVIMMLLMILPLILLLAGLFSIVVMLWRKGSLK